MTDTHSAANLQHFQRLVESGRIRIARDDLFDREPDPLPSTLGWDRIEGMLLGLAIGDALGRPAEGLFPEVRRARHGEIRDYLPNARLGGSRVGLPSDDSQLAFWTLERLLEDGGLVPANVARVFGERPIHGIGQTVLKFLYRLQRGLPWDEAGVRSAGNGALMRIAPVLVPHLRRPSPALWAEAVLLAEITHNDEASTAACVAFVDLLWRLLSHQGESPEPRWWLDTFCETLRRLEGDTRYRTRVATLTYEGPLWRFAYEQVGAALEQGLDAEEACGRWRSGAYLMETVPSVLLILCRHGHDAEEAIVRAVNDTMDNDSIAAIVGSAVGALHGSAAFPEGWVRRLTGRTQDHDDGRVFHLIDKARDRWF